MKFTLTRNLAVLATCFVALSSFAETPTPESNLPMAPANELGYQPSAISATGKYKVVRIKVDGPTPQESDGRRIYVQLDRDVNPSPCTVKAWVRIDGSNQRGKHMLSMAMLAMSAQSDVELVVDGCDDWNTAYLVAISVER
jgi:hypothetical protein